MLHLDGIFISLWLNGDRFCYRGWKWSRSEQAVWQVTAAIFLHGKERSNCLFTRARISLSSRQFLTNHVLCPMQHADTYVIIHQKRRYVFLLSKYPLWFPITAIIVIVIAVTSLLFDVPFLEILNTFGLVVLMFSLGTLARNKDKARAYTFFGLSLFLIFVLAFQLLTL
ncbi:hypothetical protein P9302_21330 [Brevibacillus agri]|uniref:hypothetical protein n=1 Tax=Brevibacillus agri TaxID=51101 RepID=UPI002E23E72F|nr:hypothetical protein [Brevibacillus agri]